MARQREPDWIQRSFWHGANFIERRLRPLRLVLYTGLLFRKNLGFERAATLSFATLISLIPVAVLFFSIVGLLGEGERINQYVNEEVLPMLIPEGEVNQEAENSIRSNVASWLNDNISPTVFKSEESKLVNLSAVFALIFTAVGSMATAERIFNRIWHVGWERSYLQKAVAFWLLLTTSPLLIGASIYLGELLVPKGGAIDSLREEYEWIGMIYGFLVPVTVGFIAFCLLFRFLPAARVRWRSAALGAIVAALLWECSKRGFFLYVGRAANVTNFYGKLATLPLFLVWIYLSWIITLIGNQLAYTHQNFFAIRRARQLRSSEEQRYSPVYLGFSLLEAILEGYHSDVPATVDDAAAMVGVPAQRLESIAHHLVTADILVEDANNDNRYVFARAPEDINLATVARTLVLTELPNDEFEGAILSRRESSFTALQTRAAWDAFLAELEKKTVRDLQPLAERNDALESGSATASAAV